LFHWCDVLFLKLFGIQECEGKQSGSLPVIHLEKFSRKIHKHYFPNCDNIRYNKYIGKIDETYIIFVKKNQQNGDTFRSEGEKDAGDYSGSRNGKTFGTINQRQYKVYGRSRWGKTGGACFAYP